VSSAHNRASCRTGGTGVNGAKGSIGTESIFTARRGDSTNTARVWVSHNGAGSPSTSQTAWARQPTRSHLTRAKSRSRRPTRPSHRSADNTAAGGDLGRRLCDPRANTTGASSQPPDRHGRHDRALQGGPPTSPTPAQKKSPRRPVPAAVSAGPFEVEDAHRDRPVGYSRYPGKKVKVEENTARRSRLAVRWRAGRSDSGTTADRSRYSATSDSARSPG
jgi:hypothetical protein